MKKNLLIIVSLLLVAQLGFSGGLVTNTNQSASWTRMLVRDASTQIDAVFYNPAGLVKLNDGFHFSVSNQFLFQKQTITNSYSYLNNNEYVGNISAPVFPGVYGAWKKGKLAVSVGFNPIGGGGGAAFDNGLPMMEVPFAGLVPALGQLGVSAYNMKMSFEGTSVYFGIQAGLSYEITENVSVFAGARYVWAKNTYNGYIKDVTVTTPSGDLPPGAYVSGVSDQAAAGAQQANGAAATMQPIIDGGGGAYSLAELEGAGMITAAQRAQLEGGLVALGIATPEEIAMLNAAEIQGAYAYAGGELAATSQFLAGQAAYLGVVTADQEADVLQTGNGITPILGANFSFLEDKLNIGVKYEFQTNMDLTTEVKDNKGFVTGMNTETGEKTYMFLDGDVTNADIPAYLSVGVQYSIIDPLRVQLGYHTYFDKGMDWAKAEDGTVLIDKNFAEYGIGLEFDITEKFLASAGFLIARTGVNEKYQSDLDYSLSTNTVGGGFAYDINDKFTAQIGGFYTMYADETYKMQDSNGIDYETTYDKLTYALSIGIDIHL